MGEQDILLEASRHADFARHQAEGDITHSSFMGCRDFFTNTGKFFSPDEDSIASCREPGMAKGVKSKKCRCGQCQPYFGSL